MSHYRLALLGFGNVGRALARLLLRKEAELERKYDINFTVTGIATGRTGLPSIRTASTSRKPWHWWKAANPYP